MLCMYAVLCKYNLHQNHVADSTAKDADKGASFPEMQDGCYRRGNQKRCKACRRGKGNALQAINNQRCHDCHREHTPQIAHGFGNLSAAENKEGQGALQKGADAADGDD